MSGDGVAGSIERLTDRQREALRLYAANVRGKRAGAAMGISENTIGGYLSEAARLLGTSREGAAARLTAYETAHPNTRGRFSVGDPDLPSMVVVLPAQEQPSLSGSQWSRLLPFRIGNGDPRDLTPIIRLAWIIVLAVALATAFGQLAAGAHFLNDIVPRI